MMNVDKFIEQLKKAESAPNVYAFGMFGGQITEGVIKQKKKQYPTFYNTTRMAVYEKLYGQGVYGYDCCGLAKSVLWGWNDDKKATYGGAVYGANGVPDISADVMINKCTNVSTNFSTIEKGEFVWMPGHCGVYIGDGLCIECTTNWENKIQTTACGNISAKQGYKTRTWTKHGKLPWVDYGTKEASTATKAEKGIVVGVKVKLSAEATKYATGQAIPDWVKKQTYTVKQIKSDRTLLKEINSWVYNVDISEVL